MLAFLDCLASHGCKENPSRGEGSRLGMPSLLGTCMVLHVVNGSCYSILSSSSLQLADHLLTLMD